MGRLPAPIKPNMGKLQPNRTIKRVPESSSQVALKIVCQFPEIPSRLSSSSRGSLQTKKGEKKMGIGFRFPLAKSGSSSPHLCCPAAPRERRGREKPPPPAPSPGAAPPPNSALGRGQTFDSVNVATFQVGSIPRLRAAVVVFSGWAKCSDTPFLARLDGGHRSWLGSLHPRRAHWD
jgi:hypothetical protein